MLLSIHYHYASACYHSVTTTTGPQFQDHARYSDPKPQILSQRPGVETHCTSRSCALKVKTPQKKFVWHFLYSVNG